MKRGEAEDHIEDAGKLEAEVVGNEGKVINVDVDKAGAGGGKAVKGSDQWHEAKEKRKATRGQPCLRPSRT